MLRVEALCVSRGGRRVLDGVNLGLAPGRTLAVIGESGAGKSTLVGAILGLLRPRSGRVTWNGSPVGAAHPSLVMQEPRAAFNPALSLGRSVMEPVRARRLDLPEDRLDRLCTVLDLDPGLLEQRPLEVSVGQAQRLGILRALLAGSPLVVFDEPLSALDAVTRKHTAGLISTLQREEGFAALVVTHDLGYAAAHADDVVILRQGRIEEAAPARDLLPCASNRLRLRALRGRGRARSAGTRGVTAVADVLLRAIVVLSGTALATFALLWHAPGDPALAIAVARYDAVVSPDVIAQIRAETGLDAGFWPAFLHWITPIVAGDLGNSSVSGRPIWPELRDAIALTVPLALAGLAVGLVISVPLAILASRRPGSWVDRGAVAVASLGAAMPTYWLGLLLILLFAVHLAWLPAMGARTSAHVILPALTLGLGVAASLTRILRSGLLEARGQPFLPALSRRGVPPGRIGRDHVAPHAAIPVVTVLGLELAFLLEGAVILEVIFARPGLGSFLVHAISARDFPKVQAVVILTALLFVTVNLLIDLSYRLIDPRVGARDA